VADASMNLLDELRKEGSGDLVREAMRWLVHELMEAEVTAMVEAGPYERTAERTTQRNGHRSRRWDIRVATLELQIPRLRTGSYFSSWLEPRKRSEQALVAVVAEAYVQGVSTRKVEALVQSLGIAGIRKSQVSCLPRTGVREGLGVDVALSKDVVLWKEFLRSLQERGLRGVKLETSDAHRGLKQAIAEVFVSSSGQRCRVHFMRNVEARVPRAAQPMVAAAVRTIFHQADHAAAQA